MRANSEKDYIKLSFRNLKNLDKSADKNLQFELKGDLDKCDDLEFQEALLSCMEKSISTIWNGSHKGQDFACVNPQQGILEVKQLTDMFEMKLSSEYDIAMNSGKFAESKAKREEYEKAMKEHEEYGFDKPEELGDEWNMEEFEEIGAHNDKINRFYTCIHGMSTIDTAPTAQDKFRDEK